MFFNSRWSPVWFDKRISPAWGSSAILSTESLIYLLSQQEVSNISREITFQHDTVEGWRCASHGSSEVFHPHTFDPQESKVGLVPASWSAPASCRPPLSCRPPAAGRHGAGHGDIGLHYILANLHLTLLWVSNWGQQMSCWPGLGAAKAPSLQDWKEREDWWRRWLEPFYPSSEWPPGGTFGASWDQLHQDVGHWRPPIIHFLATGKSFMSTDLHFAK